MRDQRIDYVEIPSLEIGKSKQFYSAAFGWSYQDWGDRYADTKSSGISSGLNAVDEGRTPLVVLYADDLEATRDRVK